MLFTPYDASDKSVTWALVSGSPVELDANTGNVMAREEGELPIQVTSVDAKKSVTCKIKVLPKPTSGSINENPTKISAGVQYTSTARVAPVNAVQEVQWTVESGDASVKNKALTAKLPGRVRVRATSVVDSPLYVRRGGA